MQRYEIFQKLPSKQPTWVESATTLEEAKIRVSEIRRMFPADYFILDRENSTFVIPFDSGLGKGAESLDVCNGPEGIDEPVKDCLRSQHLDAGSRFPERRSVPRFAFIASVEMTDPVTKTRIVGRATEIGQRGCFVEAENLLTIDSIIQMRIHKSGDVFESWARVVYTRSASGMGLQFIDTAPEQAKLLTGWLEGLKEI